MEMGVWQGRTFVPMAEFATASGRAVWAVDSFCGMGPPGLSDLDLPRGQSSCPLGALSPGGSPHTIKSKTRHIVGDVRVVVGWVPQILLGISVEALCFVHVDLDHALPTRDALRWIWPRLSSGGIAVVHDWFPDSEYLTTAGVKLWMKESGQSPRGERNTTRHVWFLKD